MSQIQVHITLEKVSLQHTATLCSTLQHTAKGLNIAKEKVSLQHSATHCKRIPHNTRGSATSRSRSWSNKTHRHIHTRTRTHTHTHTHNHTHMTPGKVRPVGAELGPTSILRLQCVAVCCSVLQWVARYQRKCHR